MASNVVYTQSKGFNADTRESVLAIVQSQVNGLQFLAAPIGPLRSLLPRSVRRDAADRRAHLSSPLTPRQPSLLALKFDPQPERARAPDPITAVG